MAAAKEYAYFLKGNKISIVERDFQYGDGQTLSQPGLNDVGPRGQSDWKSPKSTVASGIELEYSYSPKYRVASNAAVDVNKFYINGWTVTDGYLTFLRSKRIGVVSFLSTPENAVYTGTEGDTGDSEPSYIVVRGSSRWNGLHKIKTPGSDGNLVTHTRVSQTVPYWEDQDIDFNTDEEMFDGGGTSNLHLADHFSAGEYIWISGASSVRATNEGLFKVASVTQSNTDTSSKVTVDTRYSVVDSTDATTSSTGLNSEYSEAAAFNSASGMSTVNVFKAYRDFCYILSDVNVLNDEADDLPVSDYLSKAVVYYVKAKLAEDRLEVEAKEYFMKEFRRMVEKESSSKQWGSSRVMTNWNAAII